MKSPFDFSFEATASDCANELVGREMGESIIQRGHDIEVTICNLLQRGHIRDVERDVQATTLSLAPRPVHRRSTQVRGDYTMAKACEPERLGSDPTGTVQNFQWMAATLRRKKRIQNPGLPLDRLIPIVEDQVKMLCERFVKAQGVDGPTPTPAEMSLPHDRRLPSLFSPWCNKPLANCRLR